MDTKKKIISFSLVLLIFGFTCYAIFSENDLEEIWKWIHKVNGTYILLGTLLVPFFICSESVIITYLMKHFGIRVPFYKSCIYSFIGFFYSCITPSASGGQPMQMVYMKKDKINLSDASIALLIITIGYKMVLVLVGIYAIIFHRNWLHQCMGKYVIFCYLGMVLNIIGIATMLAMILSTKLVPNAVKKLEKLATRLKILRKSETRRKKMHETLEQYKITSEFLNKNKGIFGPVLLISIIQRGILFYTTYLIYRGFGLTGTPWYEIVLIQSIISLSVDMLPLPGGMGISEGLFAKMFKPVFGSVLIMPGMLLSRWVSFYSVLFISGIVTLIAYFKYKGIKETT